MTIKRLGRISQPYDFARHFPETTHYQDQMPKEEGRWVKPHYFDDEEVTDKLSNGMCFQDSCFNSYVNVTKFDSRDFHDKSKRWDDDDQHQLHQEELH